MKVSISGNIVKKYFSSDDLNLFHNEIFWLKKLKNYEFIPKILNIDYSNYILSISNEGERISYKNKPHNWLKQLNKILKCLKKNNCFHSDITPDNLLVKKNQLTLIDFAQSTKITNLKKNIFLKNRIFFDQYSFNRINLTINKNVISSNDLRVLVIWNPRKVNAIEKKIIKNRNLSIIDKIKIKKNFYLNKFKDRIYCVDKFYNKNIGKNTDKLKNHIYVYVIKSINPIFMSKKMIFVNERKIVDEKIFKFKKKIRNKKTSIVHIADNFEEAKRNAIFFSRSNNNYPAKYFFKTQNIFKSKENFFKKLNKSKKLKYVVLRDQTSKNDDIDILVNDYFIFKKISDCHSYKIKNLNFISNTGDPVDENGFKVSNYILIKDKKIKLDVRFIGDGYFDAKWQKSILDKRKLDNFRYIPSDEDFSYSLLYHIVYHKGYIANKYEKFLKKSFMLKKLNLDIISKIINNFMLIKKYKIERPSDLTIPVTYKFNRLLIKEEFRLIKNQIKNRNYSGVNKMFYNIVKFQNFLVYLKIEMFFLIFLNQYNLIKSKFKNFCFKYISLNS
jgi:hypothetical protein